MVPPKSKFVSYYRVSTQKQGRSGLGLEAQKSAVDTYLRQHSGVELATFTEVETGNPPRREARQVESQCSLPHEPARLGREVPGARHTRSEYADPRRAGGAR